MGAWADHNQRIKKNVGKFCSVVHVPIEEPV